MGFNIMGILNLYILLYQFVGFGFLYTYYFPDRLDEGISNYSLITATLFYTGGTIILLHLGYFVGKLILKSKVKILAQLAPKNNHKKKYRTILMMTALCALITVIFYVNIGVENLAFSAIVNNLNSNDVALARSSMTNSYEGKLHWIQLFTDDLFLFGIIYLMLSYMVNKEISRVTLVILILIFSFKLILTTQKAPLIDFLLLIFLTKNFLFKRLKLFSLNNIKGLSIIFITLVFIYSLFMGSLNMNDAILQIGSRVFAGQLQVSYLYLEYFPNLHSFLQGTSFPNPGGLLPFENFPLTQAVHTWAHPEMAKAGIIGSMPTFFWGELYANFGTIGVIIITPIVGFILYTINQILYHYSKTLIGMTLYVYCIFYFKDLALTSLSNFLFDFNFYIIILFTLIVEYINIKKMF